MRQKRGHSERDPEVAGRDVKYTVFKYIDNKILFLVLYDTKYLFFVPMYLCFEPIYFDIHFNVRKY